MRGNTVARDIRNAVVLSIGPFQGVSRQATRKDCRQRRQLGEKAVHMYSVQRIGRRSIWAFGLALKVSSTVIYT